MRKKLYKPHIADEMYATVCNCRPCAQDGKLRKRQRQIALFFPKGPIEYVVMVILGPLLRSKQSGQFAVVMTDRYTRLTKAIPTTKINTTKEAFIFLEQ